MARMVKQAEKTSSDVYNTNVDYSKWERKANHTPSRNSVTSEGSGTEFTVSTASAMFPKKVWSLGPLKHSSPGVATTGSRWKKERAELLEEEAKRIERIRVLQLRLHARKQAMEEYRRRKKHLFAENIKLKALIEKQEASAHNEVKKLLRKCEQFRGGIITLNDRFVIDLAEAKSDLEATRLKIDEDVAELQEKVDAAEEHLKNEQLQLHILSNYKDKEYPVKNLRISELQKEIENLHVSHQNDETELQRIVETEVDKFRTEQQKIKSEISEEVTQKSIARMHPSLKDMALQNMVMRKEKEFHEEELKSLLEQNKIKEEEVKRLRESPTTNVRRQMFPELYPTQEKCTPDMEVVLDIPTKEWLPI